MRRFELAPDDQLLLRLLRHPDRLQTLSPADAAKAIDASDGARLLGWLINRLPSTALRPDAPLWFKDRVIHAEALVAEYDRAVRWELDRLKRVFRQSGIRWVLLKGSGYLAAGLSTGRGRRVADVDILVPESDLAA